MIKNIEISKISPHYANPRKDLGDLTELAESIKTNGIFQNLTVVPWFSQTTGVGADDPKQQEEMGYIVVIGHRRLAAAKLAGLTKVPCEISKMSYSEQISTMLLENMQRCDLTIYEQAQGFQMLLDLGESVNDIAQSTGFSETTVRRRVKLLEFDKEKFKDSVERGGTLMDYVEIDKIQDISTKNKVLEKIGTENFKWELKRAIDNENREANKVLLIAELGKFAKEVKSATGLSYVTGYLPSQDKKINVPSDVDTSEYYFLVTQYGCIDLYKKGANDNEVESQKNLEELAKTRELNEHRAALNEISKLAYQLRYKFVQEISNATAKKNISVIIEYLLQNILNDDGYVEIEDFATFFNVEINDEKDAEDEMVNSIIKNITAKPESQLLTMAYLMRESDNQTYYNYKNEHINNKALNAVYDFLEKLGYKMSEEESALRNGTHKLFVNLDNQNVDRGND